MKGLVKKISVFVITGMLAFTGFIGAYKLPVNASEIQQTKVEEQNGVSEKIAKALIVEGAGYIPVIGEYIKTPLDDLLKKVLGIEDTTVVDKLNQILNELNNLNLKMDEQNAQLMKELFKIQMFDDFNRTINSVKTITDSKYLELTSIASDGRLDDTKKAIMVSQLLNLKDDNIANYTNTVRTLTKYIQCKNITNTQDEGIYEASLRYQCSNSALVGEAALKNITYVNNLNKLMEDSYKLMITVIGQKIYVGSHFKGEIENLYPVGSTEYDQAKECYDNLVYYTNLLSYNSPEGLTQEYCRTYDLKNNDSVVSKYNKKVADEWFSYIQKNSKNHLEYVLVPMSSTLNTFNIENDFGLDRSPSKYSVENMIKDVNNKMRSRMNNGLNEAQSAEIYKSLRTDSLSQKLFKDKSFIEELDELGFDTSKINRNNIMLIMSSCADGGSVSTSMEDYFYGWGQYKGGNAYDKNAKADLTTIKYFDFKEHRGCYPTEKGNKNFQNVMFFEKAH